MDTLMKASLLLGTYRRPILSDDDSRRREAVDAKADTCHQPNQMLLSPSQPKQN